MNTSIYIGKSFTDCCYNAWTISNASYNQNTTENWSYSSLFTRSTQIYCTWKGTKYHLNQIKNSIFFFSFFAIFFILFCSLSFFSLLFSYIDFLAQRQTWNHFLALFIRSEKSSERKRSYFDYRFTVGLATGLSIGHQTIHSEIFVKVGFCSALDRIFQSLNRNCCWFTHNTIYPTLNHSNMF